MDEDLRLAQLLCSRLCHDIIGAAGAVNAGLEILGDGDGVDDAALHLAISSGAEITRRLAFFRVAFGAGGVGHGGNDPDGLRELAAELLESGQVELDWPPADGATAPELSPTLGKLLLNLVLIASECLPRGGVVSVRLAALDGGVGMAISADGPGARLREDVAMAMTPGTAVGGLDSRCVHGYLTQLLVVAAGCELEVAAEDDSVSFAAIAES